MVLKVILSSLNTQNSQETDGMGYLTTDAVTIDSLEDSVSVGAKQGAIITNTYSIDEFTLDTKTGAVCFRPWR